MTHDTLVLATIALWAFDGFMLGMFAAAHLLKQADDET